MTNLLEIAKQVVIENPNTLDSIYLFIGLGIISIVAIVLVVNKMMKDKKIK